MTKEELKKEAEAKYKIGGYPQLHPDYFAFIHGYLAGAEPREKRIAELEQQIEKMKRHCNCKHRDSEGYCEVKRTYLIDLSYDGCDKWELED